MIVLCSYFDSEGRDGKRMQISNSVPRGVSVDGVVECLVPRWSIVKELKAGIISEDEFVKRYRIQLMNDWDRVKAWLMGLDAEENLVLMCWEKQGEFCHRILVGKMIEKWRSDIEVVVE